jgi:hypothetical protein
MAEIATETPTFADADTCAYCGRDIDIEGRLAMLESKMDDFIELANQIKNQIEPAFDALKNSPIGKMLL